METIVNCSTGEVFVTPPTPEEELSFAWKTLRSRRDNLLADSDWTQVADAPVDKAVWAVYRQALRDFPATISDPFNPVWPVKPE